VGLSEFSRFNTDGTLIPNFHFPFDLWFVPNPQLVSLWPSEPQYDDFGVEIPFYEQLKEIPESSMLFEVWAQEFPDDRPRYPTTNV